MPGFQEIALRRAAALTSIENNLRTVATGQNVELPVFPKRRATLSPDVAQLQELEWIDAAVQTLSGQASAKPKHEITEYRASDESGPPAPVDEPPAPPEENESAQGDAGEGEGEGSEQDDAETGDERDTPGVGDERTAGESQPGANGAAPGGSPGDEQPPTPAPGRSDNPDGDDSHLFPTPPAEDKAPPTDEKAPPTGNPTQAPAAPQTGGTAAPKGNPTGSNQPKAGKQGKQGK